MAGSDYSLRLRATLDTTQVQQELKKLRSAQAMVLDPGGSGTNKGLQGVSHMQKIEVQLTKLNSSIAGLQRAIEQLSRTQSNTAHQSNVLQGKFKSPQLPYGMTKKEFGSWLDSSEYKKLNNKVANVFKSYGLATGRLANYGGETFDLNDPYLANKVMGTGQLKGLDKSLNKSNYQDLMTNWNRMNNHQAQKQQLTQGRQFAGVIGGQILGGAGELASSLGYTGIGNFISSVGSGFTGGASTAMGMSLAGFGAKASSGVGIAVGLATAIAENISNMEQLAQAVNKTAQAFEENYKQLHHQTIGIQDSIIGSRHRTRANQLLESGNIDEAKKQANYWTNAYESAKSSFENTRDPSQVEMDIIQKAEREKAMVEKYIPTSIAENWFGKDNTTVEFLNKAFGFQTYGMRKQDILNKIDNDAQIQIKDMHQRYKDLESEMNKYKGYADTYQSVADKLQNDKNAEAQKSNAEVQKRLALSERNDQTIARYEAQSRVTNTQALANGILGNNNLSPLEKFNKISDELDKLRATRKTALEGAYGISKEIAGGKMTSEEMTRAMAKQSKYEFQASSAANLIGILENALTNINTQTIAPDLSHMTSLSQYGFNMGEKDNSVERMEKYYNRSLTLQQQIKDKLQEGIKTEAVYN